MGLGSGERRALAAKGHRLKAHVIIRAAELSDATVAHVRHAFGDQELIKRGFMEAGIVGDIRVVNDGEEALDYLLRRARYTDAEHAPAPDLVLLDLNMPRVDGRQVLTEVRSRDSLKCLPVVVMTTSSHGDDIRHSYECGANSYITKPVTFPKLVEVVEMLGRYWLGLVSLPGQGSQGGEEAQPPPP